MTFSERLRQLRQEKKMTQAVLGRAIDISPRMISFYESGNHFPRDEIIPGNLLYLDGFCP